MSKKLTTAQLKKQLGVFIVENLCNLVKVIGRCVINTYPMNYTEMTGLPCRVVAEV